MRKPTVKCALLAAMLAKHRWGTPIDADNLLAIAAVDQNDYPTARAVFDELREEPYITNCGKRGIELDNSRFGGLQTFSITSAIGNRSRSRAGSNTTKDGSNMNGRDALARRALIGLGWSL